MTFARIALISGAVTLGGLAAAYAVTSGVAVGAFRQFGRPVSGWGSCSSLVAYWTLDETTGVRASSSGSCTTSCDLTAQAGTDTDGSVPYCRGARSTTSGEYLSCADATCTALDFAGVDFTVVGWARFPQGTSDQGQAVNKSDGSGGYELLGWSEDVASGSNPVRFYVGTDFAEVDNAADVTDYSFFAGSWDETNDDIRLCAAGPAGVLDRSASFWSCTDNTLATGPVAATAVDFKVANASTAKTVVVDELSIWGVNLTDDERCFLCSCRLHGTACQHLLGQWFNRGGNVTECGACTLPSVGSDGSVACPS